MTDEFPEWTVPAFKWINKKGRETWTVQCGSSQWKVQYIIYLKRIWKLKYEFAETRINCFT